MELGLLANVAIIIAGFFALIWSADRFVLGASSIARGFGISPMVIGLTVVAIGTSSPEIFVSMMSTMNGSGGMAVGNAVGSNIANLTLVLGVAALIAPIAVKSNIVRREFPLLFAVTLLAGLLMEDGQITRTGGVLLLVATVMTLHFIVKIAMESPDEVDSEVAVVDERPLPSAIFWLVVGLAVLVISSRFVVSSATDIAVYLGVSEVIIGLTIVAIGTSLPEVATTAVSALKGQHDMAIGGVIGSNIFNMLVVLGVAPLVGQITVPQEILTRDFVVMAVITIALFLMSVGWRKDANGERRGQINRVEGGVILAVYVAYCAYLYLTSI